jgi:flagellar basal body-associated protein FliL
MKTSIIVALLAYFVVFSGTATVVMVFIFRSTAVEPTRAWASANGCVFVMDPHTEAVVSLPVGFGGVNCAKSGTVYDYDRGASHVIASFDGGPMISENIWLHMIPILFGFVFLIVSSSLFMVWYGTREEKESTPHEPAEEIRAMD